MNLQMVKKQHSPIIDILNIKENHQIYLFLLEDLF